MDRESEKFAALYGDEVVEFIACRHHTTPQCLIAYFLRCEGMLSGQEKIQLSFPLEENEVEILRGLLDALLRKQPVEEKMP